ncbi:MAG TPA: NUDIX domain-containing protein [Candidatus Sulfotelmatobacter sp.]|nr:NUDIX domain-containing protein [Candidatus Sulfotelmatobacter sp.]
MKRKVDIHKAAGIIIRNRKLLVERSKGKEFFIAPGGSIESGETAEQALVRELKEEFRIDTTETDFDFFGTFYAEAAGQEERWLQSDIFIVKTWKGEPTPDNEVEMIDWITSDNPKGHKIGSIFEHEVMPRLKARGLID